MTDEAEESMVDSGSKTPFSRDKLDLNCLHILSEIHNRFAITEFTCGIVNRSNKEEEATLVINHPSSAFVTNLEMEINGKMTVIGKIKQKDERKERKLQKEEQFTAERTRDTNQLEISVKIKQKEEAKIRLEYQELLQRISGVYRHLINIEPEQFVSDLLVDVYIVEKPPFRLVQIPKIQPKLEDKSNHELLQLEKGNEVSVEETRKNGVSRVSIRWQPSIETKLGVLAGQMAVLYDLEREEDAGQIQVANGFFIHHFVPPKGLKVGNKSIIFALDTSESMSLVGKLDETKKAMNEILSQLQSHDTFNIISFNNKACRIWQRKCAGKYKYYGRATTQNIKHAKRWIAKLSAYTSGTREIEMVDMDAPLRAGINLLGKTPKSQSMDVSLVILLGSACERGSVIPASLDLMKRNDRSVKIYGLALGYDADFDFVNELSLKTRGFARKINADSNAARRICDFYEEISSPILGGVALKYPDPYVDVESVVQENERNTFFEGSEMVSVGRVTDDIHSVEVEVRGITADGVKIQKKEELKTWTPPIAFLPTTVVSSQEIVERSWAFLVIKDLSARAAVEENMVKFAIMKEKMLRLSLKYGFLSPVTSMIPSRAGTEEANRYVTKVSEDQTMSMSFTDYKPPPESQLTNTGEDTDYVFLFPLIESNEEVLKRSKDVVKKLTGDKADKSGHSSSSILDENSCTKPLGAPQEKDAKSGSVDKLSISLDSLQSSVLLNDLWEEVKLETKETSDDPEEKAMGSVHIKHQPPELVEFKAMKLLRTQSIQTLNERTLGTTTESACSEDVYQALSIGDRLPSYIVDHVAKEIENLEALDFWLNQSVDVVNEEYHRLGFHDAKSLFSSLRRIMEDSENRRRRRPFPLCCCVARDKKSASAAALKTLMGNREANKSVRMQDVMEKADRGEQLSEYDWILCCFVISKFSREDIQDFLYFCKATPPKQEDSGTTFHIGKNSANHLGKSDILLKKEDWEKSLDVKSESLFDAIQIVFRLTKILPSIALPDGVKKLINLLFECPQKKKGGKEDKALNHAAKEIKKAVTNP